MKLSWEMLDGHWERLDQAVDAAFIASEEDTEGDHPVWLLLEFPEPVFLAVRGVVKCVGYVIGSLL